MNRAAAKQSIRLALEHPESFRSWLKSRDHAGTAYDPNECAIANWLRERTTLPVRVFGALVIIKGHFCVVRTPKWVSRFVARFDRHGSLFRHTPVTSAAALEALA